MAAERPHRTDPSALQTLPSPSRQSQKDCSDLLFSALAGRRWCPAAACLPWQQRLPPLPQLPCPALPALPCPSPALLSVISAPAIENDSAKGSSHARGSHWKSFLASAHITPGTISDNEYRQGGNVPCNSEVWTRLSLAQAIQAGHNLQYQQGNCAQGPHSRAVLGPRFIEGLFYLRLFQEPEALDSTLGS